MANEWRNKLSEGLENYSEAAPEGLWTAVSGTLSRQRRIRRRRRAFAACAVFACAAVVIMLFLPGRSVTVPPQMGDGFPLVADMLPLESGNDDSRHARPDRASFAAAGQIAGQAGNDAPAAALPAPPETKPSPLPGTAAEPLSGTATDLSPETETEPVAGTAKRPEDTIYGFSDDPFAEEAPAAAARKRSRNRLALNLAFSGQGEQSSSAEGYGAMYGSGVSAALTSSSAAPGLAVAGPLPEVLLDNNFREVNTDVRHYRPVRLALSLSWEFAPRLSLMSGLSYSCLVSDMSSGTQGSRYDIRQTLHYVGLPLSVGWTLPLAQRLDFCLSAGGMVEKCVYGQSATSYVMDSKRIGREASAIAVEPLQWSVKASAGLIWNPAGRVGVFVEPGIVRYFDSGSPVETLYSERPLNFDLSVGLRWNLR